MLKIIIWVVSDDGSFLNDALNILGRQHNGIEIVGVTADVKVSVQVDGEAVPFIPLASLIGSSVCDVLLVVGAIQIGMSKVVYAARQLKLPEEKLLGDWIVCIPGFTLEKYRRLQRSRLSIFSTNCFGGLISHLLGLPFNSPFINMFLKRADFNRFLESPREYMAENLILKEMKRQTDLNFYYPVVKMGDLEIYQKDGKYLTQAYTII